MLTITQFADRTGISPSALRFYERKGLLLPTQRLENGYRVYAPAQVAEAQLINSLRQAEVSLEEIRRFLALDPQARSALLARWRSEVNARLLLIQMAGQYLERLEPENPQIHLHRWEEPSLLLWFSVTAPAGGPLPFASAVVEHGRRLERLGLPVLSGGYVRTLDLEGGRLTGEVGFRVEPGRKRLPPGARVQEAPPALFATLECSPEDEKAAHRIFRFMEQFGYQPTGLHFERYLAGEERRYQLMIGVGSR